MRSDESLDLRWFALGRAARGRVARTAPRLVDGARMRLGRDERASTPALALVDPWPVAHGGGRRGRPGRRPRRRTVTDRAPFALASVTKPLAGLAMLVAVEEGAVELDHPADEAAHPGRDAAPPARPRLGPGARTPAALVRARPSAGCTPTSASSWRPTLVETAVGLPFARYFDEALVRPLGLTGDDAAGLAGARRPLQRRADLARRHAASSCARPGCCIPTTLADATTVQYPGLRGVLPGFGGQDPNDWGLGFEIRGGKSPHWTGSANSPATFGHFGQSGTMFWVDPAAGVGVVALTDRPFERLGPDGVAAVVRRRARRPLTARPRTRRSLTIAGSDRADVVRAKRGPNRGLPTPDSSISRTTRCRCPAHGSSSPSISSSSPRGPAR